MSNFRLKGALGSENNFGLGMSKGPVDSPFGLGLELKDEFTPLTPGTFDLRDWVEEATREILKAGLAARKEDEEELKVLIKIYSHVATKEKKPFSKWVKKGKGKRAKWVREYMFDDYIKYRDAFFGSREKYKEALTAAIKELDHKPKRGPTLRFYIEPPKAIRKKHKKDWQKAQNVFYTWVRKAFHKEHGEKKDYPTVIRTGKSEDLQKKLDKVTSDYKKKFRAGGFNPRPMKVKIGGRYHYRFGTISDHGVGQAIDIEARTNPQISAAVWSRLETYTGKKMTAAQRKAAWKKEPKKLYDHIKGVSDEFVKKVHKAVDDMVDDAQKKVDGAKKATKSAEDKLAALNKEAEKKKESLAAIGPQQKVIEAAKKKQKEAEDAKKVIDDAIKKLKDKTVSNKSKSKETKLIIDKAQTKDKQLKAISDNFIIDWAFEHKGFITLEWDLVEACQDAGLNWGATFGDNIDIHHFQL